jgi:DNA-binding NarL/FixJ family response regulator
MLGSNSLFRESIESLICQEIEVEIVGRETSVRRALKRVEMVHPDVIIVDSSDPEFNHGKVVSQVLQLGLAMKVIGLNLHDNRLCIYRGEQKVARETKDLLEAIES